MPGSTRSKPARSSPTTRRSTSSWRSSRHCPIRCRRPPGWRWRAFRDLIPSGGVIGDRIMHTKPCRPGAKGGGKGSWKDDLLASVVVFLVALPLCMGIAIASGMPPAAGLITGIVGGLIVGWLAGSPLQVSGPAAGLAVVVADLIQDHGLGVVGIVIFLAGVIQLAAGLLRLGQWFRAVSPAVIMGMLAGIGVLIFASQFHVMVDDQPKGSGLDNLFSIPEGVWKGLVPLDDESVHHKAAMIGLLTIGIIV